MPVRQKGSKMMTPDMHRYIYPGNKEDPARVSFVKDSKVSYVEKTVDMKEVVFQMPQERELY